MIRRDTGRSAHDVPAGWSRKGWVGHLRGLADSCEKLVPERAKELRKWADKIEAAGDA